MPAPDTHTTARAIRIEDELWLPFGRLVGVRDRARVIREFIRWYIRESDELPQRPELRGAAK